MATLIKGPQSLERMEWAVKGLLETYRQQYGDRLQAYKALIKDLDLGGNKKLIAEAKPKIIKTAMDRGIISKGFDRMSKDDFARMSRVIASVYSTDAGKGIPGSEKLFADIYEKILSEGSDGQDAWRWLFNTQAAAEKAGGDFLVGHHGQGLKSFFPTWKYLVEKSGNKALPNQVMDIFRAQGQDFGEQSLRFIATLAHKPADIGPTKGGIRADWRKALNEALGKNPGDAVDLDAINPNLKALLEQSQAHKTAYGGLKAFQINPEKLLGDLDLSKPGAAQSVAERLKDAVYANNASLEQAEAATKVIMEKGFKDGKINLNAWKEGGDLEKGLRELPVINVLNPEESALKKIVPKQTPTLQKVKPSDVDVFGGGADITRIGADGTAALTQPNFYQSAVDNIASSADNLLAQTTGLVNHLKMQGIKTAIKSPEQLANELTTKYGVAGAMSMMLDPKFRQAMNEGRFTDAATRLVIEEAIGDAAFKGLKAGYHNIPGVKPIVQGIGKHIVKPVITGAATNPYVRAGLTLGAAALADMNRPANPVGPDGGEFPITGPNGKITYVSMEDYNKQRALNKKEQNLPPSAISAARYRKQERDELWWQQGGAGAK